MVFFILPQARSLCQYGIRHLTGSLKPTTRLTRVGHTSSTTTPPSTTESRESSQLGNAPNKIHRFYSDSELFLNQIWTAIYRLGYYFNLSFQSHQHHQSTNVFYRIIFNDFYSAIKNKWCVSVCPSATCNLSPP